MASLTIPQHNLITTDSPGTDSTEMFLDFPHVEEGCKIHKFSKLSCYERLREMVGAVVKLCVCQLVIIGKRITTLTYGP